MFLIVLGFVKTLPIPVGPGAIHSGTPEIAEPAQRPQSW